MSVKLMGACGVRHSAIACLALALFIAPSAIAGKVSLRAGENVSNSSLLNDLRKALPAESAPETAFEAKRQNRRAVQQIEDELNARGYFAPNIQTIIETDDGFRPIVILDPGTRFTIGEIGIDYSGDRPGDAYSAAASASLTLNSGEIAIPGDVISQETLIITTLRDEGFPYANIVQRQVIGDKDNATLDVTYIVDAGPRVRFGNLIYKTDDIRTRQSYLDKLVTFEAGDVYDPDILGQFSGRLDETRLFSISNAHLAEEPSGYSETGEEIRDVVVTLKERKRNTLEAGVSLSTDKGFGVTSELTRRNVTNRGDFLTATLDVTSIEQSFDLQWRRPHQFGYGRTLVLNSSVSNEDTDAFTRQSFALGGGVEIRTRNRIVYGFGTEGRLVSEEDDFGSRDLQILSFYGNASIDRANSVLNATKGWKAEVRAEPSVSFGGDEAQFIQTTSQVRGYYPFNDDHSIVLAGRVRVGTVLGAEIETLPSTNRFFAGGGGSVRGYSYQGIGPRSPDNDPIGGRSLLETAIEARWRFMPNISAVGFVDAGSVSTGEVPNLSDLRAGAGVGVRYDTPAGPLRVDVAIPLDKTENDDPFHIYISLGQAF